MAKPKKKISDPALSMEQLLNKAVDLFQEPYDDRDERESSLPSLQAVADQMNTTILRVRKLLITKENGTIKRDYEYKRLGTVSLLAAIDLLTGEAIPLVRDTHKSEDFIDFLKILNEKYP